MKKQEKQNNSKLKIIPLGGLEQIGMNITAFEYEDSIIVVDCGLAFPEDDMYGVDLVIPDVTYLKENIDRVKGFFITHGHGSYWCHPICFKRCQCADLFDQTDQCPDRAQTRRA